MTVLELLSDPAHWTQGFLALDADGISVDPESTRATCWCLEGAIQKCYPRHEDYLEVRTKLAQHGINHITFNDNHSHAEVLDLIRRVRI